MGKIKKKSKTGTIIIFLFIIISIILILSHSSLAVIDSLPLSDSSTSATNGGSNKFIVNQNETIKNVSMYIGTTGLTQVWFTTDRFGINKVHTCNIISNEFANCSFQVNMSQSFFIFVNRTSGAGTMKYNASTTSVPRVGTGLNYTEIGGNQNGQNDSLCRDILSIGSEAIIYGNVTNSYNLTLYSDSYINTTKTDDLNIKLVVKNDTNINLSTLNGSNAIIYYSINTSLNNGCAIFYQKVCQQNGTYLNKTMIMQSNSSNNITFNYSFDDNDYFPAYYPFNQNYIEKTTHQNDTVYTSNNILFKVYNMSTSSNYYINMEFDARNKTNVLSALLIYYCNSSYLNNPGNPSLRSSCELIDSFTTSIYESNHNNTHSFLIPVIISNVTKTQESYFVFVGNSNSLNGWNFGYVTNSTYDNSSFEYGNFNQWNTTPTKTNHIYDIHIHPYATNDNFRFYSKFNDGNGTINTSIIKYLFYNITYQPPSAPDINLPICNAQYTLGSSRNIDINWTQSKSQQGFSINYTLFYSDVNNTISNDIYTGSNTFFNWTSADWNNQLNVGDWYFYIIAYDNFGQDTGMQTCTFNICQNNYVQALQPCVSGLEFKFYNDLNNCNEMLNIPTDNNTYINCTVPPIDINTPTNLINGIYAILILLILIVFYLIKSHKKEKELNENVR